MANASVKEIDVFKKALNLLSPKNAKEAGFRAVQENINARKAMLSNIDSAFKTVITDSSKEATDKAMKVLRGHGFRPKDGEDIVEAATAFQAKAQSFKPDEKLFKSNRKEFLKKDHLSKPDFVAGATKEYFTNGSKAELAARYGTIAGGYVGGALGIRYADGGTATRNSKGERDIAGIPFI